MSDFGAIIIFRKKAGAFLETDKIKIISQLKAVISTGDYPGIIKKGNFATLNEWDNDALCSKLTEYYDGDDAGDVRQFAGEEDLVEADNIVGKLKSRLGNDYEISSAFEDW